MKFLSLLAFVSAASAVKFDWPYGDVPCEYQKSEDGTECIAISVPCNSERSTPPKHISDCPVRMISSTRTDTPEHDSPVIGGN